MEGDHPAVRIQAHVKRCGSRRAFVDYGIRFFTEKIPPTYRCIDTRKGINSSIITDCCCLSDVMNYSTNTNTYPLKEGFIEWLLYYDTLDYSGKRTALLNIIRAARTEAKVQSGLAISPMKIRVKGNQVYTLPLIRVENTGYHGTVNGNNHPLICRNALQVLTNIGKTRWFSLERQVKENYMIGKKHALEGRVGERANKSIKPTEQAHLHSFFKDMMDLAYPRATKFVRSLTSFDTRDDDTEVLELPSSFSKRQLFGRYAKGLGYLVVTSEKKTQELKKDPEAEDDDVSEPTSWASFHRFWKKNYPKLVLPKPREDICGECFLFANTFRSSKGRGLT